MIIGHAVLILCSLVLHQFDRSEYKICNYFGLILIVERLHDHQLIKKEMIETKYKFRFMHLKLVNGKLILIDRGIKREITLNAFGK